MKITSFSQFFFMGLRKHLLKDEQMHIRLPSFLHHGSFVGQLDQPPPQSSNFELVRGEAWRLLLAWYGGGPALPRPTYQERASGSWVYDLLGLSLRVLTFLLFFFRGKTTFTPSRFILFF